MRMTKEQGSAMGQKTPAGGKTQPESNMEWRRKRGGMRPPERR